MLCKACNDYGFGWIVSPARLFPDLDTTGEEYRDRWVAVVKAVRHFEGTDRTNTGVPPVFSLHNNMFCDSYSVELPSELM